jgi:hypothetical protein
LGRRTARRAPFIRRHNYSDHVRPRDRAQGPGTGTRGSAYHLAFMAARQTRRR